MEIFKSLKTNFKFFILLFITILLFYNCANNENPYNPSELKKYKERIFGKIPLSAEHIIIISNDFGEIIIQGKYQDNTIGTLLSKMVKAETYGIAKEHFDDIKLSYKSENDTLHLVINAPDPTDRIECYCSLHLEVPSKIECQVEHTYSNIYIYDLDSTFTVQNSENNVELKRHSGSCRINTSNGNISIESALPDSGFCCGITASGDITANIHVTSAVVYLKSDSGTVKYNGLTIDNLIQQSGLIRGIVGSGNGEITLKTKKGNIKLEGI